MFHKSVSVHCLDMSSHKIVFKNASKHANIVGNYSWLPNGSVCSLELADVQ